MKKNFFFLSCLVILTACNNRNNSSGPAEVAETIKVRDIENGSFNELFTEIKANEITEDVFKLVGEDFTVITSGNESDYNSMLAGWGGWGVLFNKPSTWCFLRANRYTLEYIKKEHTYTMAYFDEPYKDQIMIFGTQSGRDSDKMKESALHPIATPSGSMAFKEAKLIIECKLTEITTVSPEDFFTVEGKEFVSEAYREARDYHKIVFGEIVSVWQAK